MAAGEWLSIDGDSLRIEIKAQAGASKTEIAGVRDGRLRVRIAKAPQDGLANAELCRFLAAILGCPRGKVRLLRGEKSRLKTLAVPRSCAEKARALAPPG
ncbi:MAG: DUF167 domain-containing protein [Treponema sp.]|jgi:uncharacterized protein (TIGR00251 family)|nr:DUF167 domain-containing protein [Treponema sp.]